MITTAIEKLAQRLSGDPQIVATLEAAASAELYESRRRILDDHSITVARIERGQAALAAEHSAAVETQQQACDKFVAARAATAALESRRASFSAELMIAEAALARALAEHSIDDLATLLEEVARAEDRARATFSAGTARELTIGGAYAERTVSNATAINARLADLGAVRQRLLHLQKEAVDPETLALELVDVRQQIAA